jgi:hypothetical protein
MRRLLPLFAAALVAGLFTLLIPLQAEAGAMPPLAKPAATVQLDANLLTLAGYYGGYQQGDDYDRDQGDGYGKDDSYGHNDDYGRDKGYGHDNGYGHDEGYGYKKHHYCSTHYEKKYVCDQTEPRCFRQRECIWNYGREYCRYVQKCVGGEKYCKWVSYPISDCGCHGDYCD